MREIKFRAWDSVRRKWITDYVIDNDGFVMTTPNSSTYYDGLHETKIVLQQFTGLKDKHGQEIYDGDICQTDVNKKKWKIIFINQAYAFESNNELYYFHEYTYMLEKAGAFIEVIGNIYEDIKNTQL